MFLACLFYGLLRKVSEFHGLQINRAAMVRMLLILTLAALLLPTPLWTAAAQRLEAFRWDASPLGRCLAHSPSSIESVDEVLAQKPKDASCMHLRRRRKDLSGEKVSARDVCLFPALRKDEDGVLRNTSSALILPWKRFFSDVLWRWDAAKSPYLSSLRVLSDFVRCADGRTLLTLAAFEADFNALAALQRKGFGNLLAHDGFGRNALTAFACDGLTHLIRMGTAWAPSKLSHVIAQGHDFFNSTLPEKEWWTWPDELGWTYSQCMKISSGLENVQQLLRLGPYFGRPGKPNEPYLLEGEESILATMMVMWEEWVTKEEFYSSISSAMLAQSRGLSIVHLRGGIVRCGKYWASSCEECAHTGESACDQDCHWVNGACKAKSSFQPIAVRCGGHYAASCTECPQGHGEMWCNGECVWIGGTEECVPAAESVSCGLHRAVSCKGCPQGHGELWCNGDCHWVKGSCVRFVATCEPPPKEARSRISIA